MKKIAISLISIVTLSMMLMAVAPVFAAKPVGDAHITLAPGSTYLQVNVYNDGGVAITGVEITITAGGPIPSGNFYPVAGWSVIRSTDHALYETSGRTAIRKGQVNACGGFNCNPSFSYTVSWTVYDRKGNPLDSGTINWN